MDCPNPYPQSSKYRTWGSVSKDPLSRLLRWKAFRGSKHLLRRYDFFGFWKTRVQVELWAPTYLLTSVWGPSCSSIFSHSSLENPPQASPMTMDDPSMALAVATRKSRRLLLVTVKYAYLEPKWSLFLLERALFWRLTFNNRGHLGSR